MSTTDVVIGHPRRLLVSSTLALWGASLVGLAAGVARGKTSAVYLGSEGMGLIAQLNYLSLFLGTIAVLGLSNGCIRLLAEARAVGDVERELRVRSIVLVYPLAAGGLLALVLTAAAPVVDSFFLGESRPAAIAIAALSVPLGMAAGSFAIVLQGAGEIHRLAVANALAMVAATTIVISSIVLFGIEGAIASVGLTSCATLAVYVVREPRMFRGLTLSRQALFDKSILHAVYVFGLASVVLAVLASALDLSLRTLLVHELGVSGNGLYQPVSFLSTQLFLGLIAALSIYLFPSLTALYARGAQTDADREINEGLRLLLAAVVPAVLLIIALAPFLLRLAFSAEFVAAQTALGWQLAGEVMRAGAWVVGAVLLPLGLVRAWLGIGFATLAVQAALAFLLVGPLGLEGMSIAYAGAWSLNLGLAYAVARRSRRLTLTPRSIAHLALGISLALTAAALTQFAPGEAQVATFTALLLWWALTLRPSHLRAAAPRFWRTR